MTDAGVAESFGRDLALVAARVEPGRHVPLVGVIAAGAPFETFEVRDTLEVARGTWKARDVFALRVRGHSMRDDGILDGDYLLVEPRTQIADGQTVVAEIDGRATVKRFYREPAGNIRLQPANDAVLPLVMSADRVTIRGVVVGVLRKHGFTARRAKVRPPVERPPAVKPAADNGTLDLALRIVQHNLAEWERVTAALPRGRDLDADTLGLCLRAVHATYTSTANPRLRRALLNEAAKISRQMRVVVARLHLHANIRPLPL